jgi:hypothetical protein
MYKSNPLAMYLSIHTLLQHVSQIEEPHRDVFVNPYTSATCQSNWRTPSRCVCQSIHCGNVSVEFRIWGITQYPRVFRPITPNQRVKHTLLGRIGVRQRQFYILFLHHFEATTFPVYLQQLVLECLACALGSFGRPAEHWLFIFDLRIYFCHGLVYNYHPFWRPPPFRLNSEFDSYSRTKFGLTISNYQAESWMSNCSVVFGVDREQRHCLPRWTEFLNAILGWEQPERNGSCILPNIASRKKQPSLLLTRKPTRRLPHRSAEFFLHTNVSVQQPWEAMIKRLIQPPCTKIRSSASKHKDTQCVIVAPNTHHPGVQFPNRIYTIGNLWYSLF